MKNITNSDLLLKNPASLSFSSSIYHGVSIETDKEFPVVEIAFRDITAPKEVVGLNVVGSLDSVFTLKIVMPCEAEYKYKNLADIPKVSTPCDCGDETHWVVKYE